VPDHRGVDTPILRPSGKLFGVPAPVLRKRTLWVDDRIDRIRVVNQEQHLSPEL
jgi:hypothetical protein